MVKRLLLLPVGNYAQALFLYLSPSLNSGVFFSYFLDNCVAPLGLWLSQHVRLGWKCLVCVQGDPLALPEILLPTRTRKTAGPGTDLSQPPNLVPDAQIPTKKVQTEHTHCHEGFHVQDTDINRRNGHLEKRTAFGTWTKKSKINFQKDSQQPFNPQILFSNVNLA